MHTRSDERARQFVIAAHGDIDQVETMLAEDPSLLNLTFEWEPGNTETPIQAAAHVGNRPIAELLLARGAPLDICTAAMLGRRDSVSRMLAEDPARARARGGHGIPLMTHVALSGDTKIARMVLEAGGGEDLDAALFGAIGPPAHLEMVRWLLDEGASASNATDFMGRSAIDRADEAGYPEIAALLRAAAAP